MCITAYIPIFNSSLLLRVVSGKAKDNFRQMFELKCEESITGTSETLVYCNHGHHEKQCARKAKMKCSKQNRSNLHKRTKKNLVVVHIKWAMKYNDPCICSFYCLEACFMLCTRLQNSFRFSSDVAQHILNQPSPLLFDMPPGLMFILYSFKINL